MSSPNTNSLTLWMSAEAPAHSDWPLRYLWALSWMSGHQMSDQSELKNWHRRPVRDYPLISVSCQQLFTQPAGSLANFFFHFLSNSSISLPVFKETSLFPCFIGNHPPVPQTVVTDIVCHLHSAETSQRERTHCSRSLLIWPLIFNLSIIHFSLSPFFPSALLV